MSTENIESKATEFSCVTCVRIRKVTVSTWSSLWLWKIKPVGGTIRMREKYHQLWTFPRALNHAILQVLQIFQVHVITVQRTRNFKNKRNSSEFKRFWKKYFISEKKLVSHWWIRGIKEERSRRFVKVFKKGYHH